MIRIAIAAALALAITLPAVPAQAQASRAFVSAAGSDSNNCINVLTPCRHFQTAYNAMPNGGEIDVLDPANYGALTVTHKLSIVGRGWATLSPVSGAAAITINADSSDTINISGVQLDGAGTTSTNGIVFNSGGSLTVTDSVLQNFAYDGSNANTGNGILLQPAAGTLAFTVTNTTASNNGGAGIYYFPLAGSPTVNGVIDHVVADANQFGFVVSPVAATGGSIVVAISDSIASNNSSVGIFTGAGSATLKVSIDNVTVSGNSYGIFANTPANVLLGRSVITGNNSGIVNDTLGTFGSYQDNRIKLNTTGDVNGGMNMLTPQ